MLETFIGSEYFASMDVASGYWQIEMDEENKRKTAFITYEGLYEFNVMPFGLTNAPATFQRLMHQVLGELIYSIAPVYIDDINVHSKTFDDHLIDLEKVFDKIRNSGMKLRKEKCEFCKRELAFLGHIVGKHGIKMDPKKVEVIKNCARPKTVQDIQAFIGKANYYRRFIKDFSKIAKPLTELTKGYTRKMQNKKDITELWTEKHEKSFKRLKKNY